MSSNRRTGALKTFSFAAGAAARARLCNLRSAGAEGRSLETGKATFEQRVDTMKHMGRPFYLGIGRVLKGRAPYGPNKAGMSRRDRRGNPQKTAWTDRCRRGEAVLKRRSRFSGWRRSSYDALQAQ